MVYRGRLVERAGMKNNGDVSEEVVVIGLMSGAGILDSVVVVLCGGERGGMGFNGTAVKVGGKSNGAGGKVGGRFNGAGVKDRGRFNVDGVKDVGKGFRGAVLKAGGKRLKPWSEL